MTSLFMIALVRAVGTHTKQVCAQALLNLVGGDCVEQLIREGVVKAFATLSFLECEVTQVCGVCADVVMNRTANGNLTKLLVQQLCAHTFVAMSSLPSGRRELANHRNVLKAVFGLIRCQSRKSNVSLFRTPIHRHLRQTTLASRSSVLRLADHACPDIVQLACT